ncbi:osmoprotectant transport system ATP-binding protein [Amphibacillus marinus]|uniref:Quaternary amine transport ATP-binding protein n=1 Tax=Amphibacillus marinus TaxID=872970 RepID=A0A1H8R979_9BACI|nr:ABC transporter ATP-binding protein [Amphibacillus marinus]SEO63129.1 osmoprotectant transport system ATP-binding protein [Amphibacillus marinus]
MLQFNDVQKKYKDGTEAIKSLNLTINKGEFFVLIGPSGCGKTTTLKTINRLIPISGGTILIDGKKISSYNINELRWNIGYVLQQIALFPHMTIEENIAIVPELKKWSTTKISNRITELLEMVGLDPDTYRNRKPHELSGGEQQRIGVIRALAADPDIILMDEPFSALDPISREKIQDDLVKLQKEINKTIVFVTHDMNEAIKLADRMCLMKNGEIVQLGTPTEIIENPVDDFVEDFISSVKQREEISIEQLIKPIDMNEIDRFPSYAPDTPLATIISILAEHKAIVVKEEDNVFGKIERVTLMDALSAQYVTEDV